MPRKSTGNDLKLLTLQPGSKFITTEMGFDTGTRTVICDEAVAVHIEPTIGMADTEIEYFTQFGRRKGLHTWMFVTNVDVESGTNGTVTMRLDFRGRKIAPNQSSGQVIKAPYFQPRTEQIQFESGGNQITISLQSHEMTYLTTRLQDADPINTLVSSPPFPTNLSALFDLETGQRLPTPRFHGFQLTDRTYVSAGIAGKRQIWQVTDTITERILF
jgi:hypothetical protein